MSGWVVAMVIVINSVISEFGWVDFWLPQNVQLQVSDYSQLFIYHLRHPITAVPKD